MERSGKESIFGLVEQAVSQPKKTPRYVSKHSGTCPPTYTTFCLAGTSKPGIANAAAVGEVAPDWRYAALRRACKRSTFRLFKHDTGETTKPKGGAHVYEKPAAYLGPPLGTLKPEPTLILQKQSKAPFVESLKEIKKNRPEILQTIRHKEKLKAATPLRTEKPIMGVRSNRNFITLNALNNIFSTPKKIEEGECDWTKKPDYGQVPKYLETIKKAVESEYAQIDTLREQGAQAEQCAGAHGGVRVLPDAERQELLAGLRKRWTQLNTLYQNTTHVVLLDTIGKARRKEQLEEQLSTIERYIDKLNTGKSILIRS